MDGEQAVKKFVQNGPDPESAADSLVHAMTDPTRMLRSLPAIALLWLSACSNGVPAGSGISAAAAPVTLPLQRGFYVASDTACEAASNATLLLFRGDGFNGSRDGCDFKTIEQTGPQNYRVTEHCADFQAGPDSATTQIVDYRLSDSTRFTSKSNDGWERDFRYCEQSSLPEDWRDNDISDLIGTAAQ